jgi:hypothetical protein
LSTEINWAKLACELGLKAPFGEYCCGREDAQRALELLIGEDTLRGAVNYYIQANTGKDTHTGSELARSVLWLLRPWSAMCGCYEIFKGANSVDTRRTAIELLRVVADRRTLPWISEFLQDEDALIQNWGIGVLDQLLFSELVEPEEAEEILRTAEQHSNESVRQRIKFIRGYLLSRADPARGHEGDGGCCPE